MGDDVNTEKLHKLKDLALKCNMLLKSENRLTKQTDLKNHLKEFEKCLCDYQGFLTPNDYSSLFNDTYSSLLISLSDSVEKCREISCKILTFLIKYATITEKSSDLIVETLVICLTSPDEAEMSEEVRLLEVEILVSIISKSEVNLLKQLNNIAQILAKCIVDPYPEVKRRSCECAIDLAFNVQSHFHMISGTLINPLLLTITHQHFKTRILCIKAIGVVVQYGNNESVKDVVGHFAQRLFDHSPLVRLAVVQVIGTWLIELPDRYSYFPQLLPLLLSALSDKTPDVRSEAEKLWQKAGEVYLKENEKDYKDQMDFPKVTPTDYPAFQPTLGCRILVQRYLHNILPALMNDIDNWLPETRVKSAELLYSLLLHAEENCTMNLQTFLDGILFSAKDEENEAVEKAIKTAELLGYFVEPKLWSDLMLKVIWEKPSANNLNILAALIRGHGPKAFDETLKKICDTLSDNFICRTRKSDSQACLLLCIEALLQTPDYKQCHFSLFVVLSSVIGLSSSDSILKKGEELMMLLCNANSTEMAMQLNCNYMLTFLEQLTRNSELWSTTSPEVSIFMYLIGKGCVNEEITIFAIPIINQNLQTEKDPKLRSALLSLVTCVLKTISSRNHEKLAPNIYSLINDGIFPNLVWSVGRTSAALRAIAVANLWEIIKNKNLTKTMLASIGEKLFPILNTLADDDLTTNRLLACKILEQLLPVVAISSEELMIHKACQEYLRCMDDESDDVRIAATKVFSSYFDSYPLDYKWHLWKAYLQHIYKNIVIHLDDKNDEVQQAVYELLKKASHILPEILIQQIESVRYVMAASDLCAELINFIKQKQVMKTTHDNVLE